MLTLTPYFDRLKALLPVNEKLRKSFDLYIGDARCDCKQKTDTAITVFLCAQDEQLSQDDFLHASYASSFNDMAYLAMRLSYLIAIESPTVQENIDLTNTDKMNGCETNTIDSTEQRITCAKKLLYTLCTCHDWVTQGKNEDRFHADLWTASLCAQTAVIYSILTPFCSDDELRIYREGMKRNGIMVIWREWLDPRHHWHALDSMGHNWWLVIVCAGGFAALALRNEDDECAFYFEKFKKGIHQWFIYPGNVLQNKKANFGVQKDYIEFLGYMTYGFSMYALLETFYRDATGDKSLFEDEFLRPQIDDYLRFFYWANDKLNLANFGDTPDRIVKHQHVIYYLSWRFDCQKLFARQDLMSDGPNEYEDFLFYPLALSLKDHNYPDPPLLGICPHTGYAMCRTGYGKDDRFLAIKTGESWNHNHLDAGTFILADKNIKIAVDSGTCNYGRAEYRGYYTTPQAHNVVLFNGHGSDADMIESGTKFSGTFPAYLSVPQSDFSYILADCTGPNVAHFIRFYRHVLLLKDYTLFIDDLQTYEPGTLEWRMHYDGQIDLNQNSCVLNGATDYISICSHGYETQLYPLYPSNQSASIGDGLRDGEMLSQRGMRDPDREKRQHANLPAGHFLSLTSQMTDKRAKLIQAIRRPVQKTMTTADMNAAVVSTPTVTELEDAIDIRIPSADGTTERILINTRADGSYMHKNSWQNIGPLRTDAFLIYEKQDKENTLLAAGMINGSRLRIKDEFAVGSLLKFDGFFDLTTHTTRIQTSMNTELAIDTKYENNVPVCKGDSTISFN